MSPIPWLEPDNVDFPPTDSALADPNGLLAVGGDLNPQRLIAAYRLGIFPWFSNDEPILWWSPNPRAVLFPEKIHISKSLKKTLRQQVFTVSADRQFHEVMQHCATIPRLGQDGTWISNDMLEAYQQLHRMGIAHSLEVWHQGKLVGGLYGLAIGGVFFGESMFSLKTDASKVAFVYLATQLQHWGFAVIDCQVTNDHLLSLGAQEIDRSLFNRLLSSNIDRNIDCNGSPHWQFNSTDSSE